MGSYGQCLYRRTNGVYVVRLCVPASLRAQVGQRELHHTTGTTSRRRALCIAAAIQGRWRRCFEDLAELNLHTVLHGSPLLAGAGAIPLTRAAEILEVTPSDLLRDAGTLGCVWWDAPSRDSGFVSDGKALYKDEDGIYIVSEILAVSEPASVGGLVKVWNLEEVVRELATAGSSRVWIVRKEGQARSGVHILWPNPPSVTVQDLWIDRAAVERARLTWARHLHDQNALALPAATVGPPSGRSAAIASDSSLLQQATPPTANRHAELPASALVQRFIEWNSTKRPGGERARWKPDEAERNLRKLRMFPELMGDPTVGQLSQMPEGRHLVERYLAQLMRLPTGPDMARAYRNLGGGATAQDLIAWSDEQRLMKRMGAATAKSYVSKLGECFTWSIAEGYIALNPAKGVVAGAVASRTRSDTQRDVFSRDDLALIFSASWFLNGAAFTAERAVSAQWRPYYYWLPLLGIHQGARLNELAQLYLDDFFIEDAVPYIWFRVAKDDQKAEAEDKSLKTENSNRKVPIHPYLLDLGLVGYVRALRDNGHTRLFPELRHDKVKGYGKEAGKWFNERFLGTQLGLERNGRKVFHSFRHNFADALQRVDCTARVRNQLIGHRRGDDLATVRYSKDWGADECVGALGQLAFGLPRIAPFDVQAALSVLRAVQRRKHQQIPAARSAPLGEQKATVDDGKSAGPAEVEAR